MKRLLSAENGADSPLDSDGTKHCSKRLSTSDHVAVVEDQTEEDASPSASCNSPKLGHNVAPGFLTKTFEIFSNDSFRKLCGWGTDGDTIIIHNIAEFSNDVLPKYFKHKNFQSFVRQLHMYNFHKTIQDPSNGEFRHQYFKEGRPDLLPLIKRKASNSGPSFTGSKNSETAVKEKDLSDRTSNIEIRKDNRLENIKGMSLSNQKYDHSHMMSGAWSQTDSVLGELVKLQNWAKQMEYRIQELEAHNRHLNSANDTLWKTLQRHSASQLKMQSKMQKIVYFLYNTVLTPEARVQLQKLDNDRWDNSFSQGTYSSFPYDQQSLDCGNNSQGHTLLEQRYAQMSGQAQPMLSPSTAMPGGANGVMYPNAMSEVSSGASMSQLMHQLEQIRNSMGYSLNAGELQQKLPDHVDSAKHITSIDNVSIGAMKSGTNAYHSDMSEMLANSARAPQDFLLDKADSLNEFRESIGNDLQARKMCSTSPDSMSRVSQELESFSSAEVKALTNLSSLEAHLSSLFDGDVFESMLSPGGLQGNIGGM